MRFRKDAVANPEPDVGREEVREMAEALSLYRSAMHHIGDREAARPFVTDRRPARTLGLGMLLAPALTVALAAAALVPVFSHLHRQQPTTVTLVNGAQPSATTVDDTALMNQIDSELSEDVPDALRPLADLSDQTTTNTSGTENKNATQE
jgi:hypothetical protein